MPNTNYAENHVIITGAMGTGKTSLVKHLIAGGIHCQEEPARAILRHQRLIQGRGVPEQSPRLFVELMLSQSLFQFDAAKNKQTVVVSDRGILDQVGYMELFGLSMTCVRRAAELHRSNNLVFFAPIWEEIYCTDDERTMSFQASQQFGERLKQLYEESGYSLLYLPKVSVEERATFVKKEISRKLPSFSLF